MPSLVRESKITVTDRDSGALILDFLSGRFTYHTRQAWLKELAEGRLALNGRPAQDGQTLAAGDELRYAPLPRPEPPVDFGTTLIARKGSLIFLNKAGNIPCHPAGCFFNHTLWAQLKCGELPGLPPLNDIHFVTRLDRETSGILLLAENAEAASEAAKALASPNAVKEYRVLVEGDFPDEWDARGFLWDAPDAIVAKRRRFSGATPPEDAKHIETAHTVFRCIRRFDGMSELTARLLTGRTHQIRATLAGLGFPVVGDKVYGVDETIFLRFLAGNMTTEDRQRLRIPRQALHAWKMKAAFLSASEPLEITAPEDFIIHP